MLNLLTTLIKILSANFDLFPTTPLLFKKLQISIVGFCKSRPQRFEKRLKTLKTPEPPLQNPVVVSPDAGGVYRAKKFREGLAQKYDIEAGLAMIVKQR